MADKKSEGSSFDFLSAKFKENNPTTAATKKVTAYDGYENGVKTALATHAQKPSFLKRILA